MFQPMLLTGTTVSTFTDGGGSGIANSVVGSFDKYMNAELFNLLCNNFAETVAMGFALTTVLILLTFGVFKAFSFIRID